MSILALSRWCACLVLAFWPLALRGATDGAWFLRAWQTEDGLPEYTIVGLEQTAEGFLRVATHEGLFRFDGVRFHEFPPAMRVGVPSAQIRLMLQDRRGRLWLAKDGGTVFCVETGAVTSVSDLSGNGFRGQPRALVEDGQSAIWVGDNEGTLFRMQEGKVETFGTAQGLARGLCRLAVDTQGRLWLSQAGRVGVFRNGTFLALFTLGKQSAPIATARAGGIWLCSGLNLYRYHEGGELKAVAGFAVEPGREALEVAVLYEDKAGGLWVGANSGGLLRYDAKGLRSVDATLPAVTAIREDSEGDIWVGSRGGGLSRFRPRAAEMIGVASGLPFVAVQSVCEDTAGTLWVAGQNGALARRGEGGWQLVSGAEGWNGGSATCLAADSGGGVLIGTRQHGVFRHHAGTFTELPVNPELTNQFIRSLCVCTNGDIWIGANFGETLCRCREGRLKTFPLPTGSGNVRTMVEGANSNLWAATSNGLFLQVVGDVLTDETVPRLGGRHRGIRCLHVTGDGSLWIGYAGDGLGWLKNGKYFGFRGAQGLWDEYISQIQGDQNDRLWVAGNRGICQIARAELEGVAEGKAAHVRSVVLGRGEGLPNLQASFGVWPVSIRSRNGRILMPMQTGLTVVQPDLLRQHAQPPSVVIEALRVNGHTVALYDGPAQLDGGNGPVPLSLQAVPSPLLLGPGVNQMDFEFTALSLASPENVTFRFKLDGVDQDWVDAGGTRVARYPRVPPGEHHFRVTACGHDGIWNETGDVMAFSIRSYLWEVTWVRFAGVACAAGLFGSGILLAARRRYQRRIASLEQRQALERERIRIAQDLHDDLGAGLVEINLSSELAQDPAVGVDEVREHTREIGTRAREMVTALDEIVWAVNPKYDTVSSLATYFCQYAQHFLRSTTVRCHLEVAKDLPVAPLNAEQRHSLFLAFKEALSNVVQHSGATDLRLAIAASDGMLIVVLGDNGRGLDPTLVRERLGADGLGNMRRRLQQLSGRCELAGGPGQGTTVTFKVPLPPPQSRDDQIRGNSIEVL